MLNNNIIIGIEILLTGIYLWRISTAFNTKPWKELLFFAICATIILGLIFSQALGGYL